MRRPRTSLPRGIHVVYVLRAHNGLLKFGHTKDLGGRISSVRATSPDPLECAAWARGGPAEEASLHLRLVADHSHSEWFFPSPAALAVVEDFKGIVAKLRRKFSDRYDARFNEAPRIRRAYRAELNRRKAALEAA